MDFCIKMVLFEHQKLPPKLLNIYIIKFKPKLCAMNSKEISKVHHVKINTIRIKSKLQHFRPEVQKISG